MREALYRKYRPKSLEDVVGQPHITQTLVNALKSGRISHGYLFSGPRGVGKTSVARILAYQINNFDYGHSSGALDIIEIDAASNRRIDEIRELRDKVHIAPVSGKYKVYIIDEVHMLTREAFNALLKTLEEPPAHTVFILATTEVHKLPETIISRTQRYSFKAVTEVDVVKHLKDLAKAEGITIDSSALKLIAAHGQGSFRDSIGLLDQLSSHSKITAETVQQMIGLPPEQLISDILEAATSGDIAKLLEQLEQARVGGHRATQISKYLVQSLRNQLLQTTDGRQQKLALMRELIEVPAASQPSQLLEIILADYCLKRSGSAATNQDGPTAAAGKTKPAAVKPALKPKAEVKSKSKPEPEPEPSKADDNPPAKVQSINDTELESFIKNNGWKSVLDALRSKHNTLYGLARMATPSLQDGKLALEVPFAFHQKRLKEDKNALIINNTLLAVTGKSISFVIEVKSASKPSAVEQNIQSAPTSDTLQSVTEIFGGGEILETQGN